MPSRTKGAIWGDLCHIMQRRFNCRRIARVSQALLGYRYVGLMGDFFFVDSSLHGFCWKNEMTNLDSVIELKEWIANRTAFS